MTFTEYAEIEERFKNDTLGRYISYNAENNNQCWDLAEVYFTKYLNLPESILAGCGLVSNMLYQPKLDELLIYFDEIDIHTMEKGDVCIWEYGHIAVFDSCPDGYTCYFVSQNPGPTSLIPLSQDGSHAFRLKGVSNNIEPVPEPPKPEPTDFKIGDYVVPTKLFDYAGTPLVQYDDLYQIIDKDERGNVLGAVRGDERPVWAVLPNSNIMKVD